MSLAEKLKSMMQQKENDNLKAGETFLAENAKKENVVSLPSGLQYEILTVGTGEKPMAHHTVTCHYHGTVISGEVFDSSVQRGQPASFPLNAVIKGWTEALQLMPVGSKWRLFLPPHLAYCSRQVSSAIRANSTLIFEVELISFI